MSILEFVLESSMLSRIHKVGKLRFLVHAAYLIIVVGNPYPEIFILSRQFGHIDYYFFGIEIYGSNFAEVYDFQRLDKRSRPLFEHQPRRSFANLGEIYIESCAGGIPTADYRRRFCSRNCLVGNHVGIERIYLDLGHISFDVRSVGNAVCTEIHLKSLRGVDSIVAVFHRG